MLRRFYRVLGVSTKAATLIKDNRALSFSYDASTGYWESLLRLRRFYSILGVSIMATTLRTALSYTCDAAKRQKSPLAYSTWIATLLKLSSSLN